MKRVTIFVMANLVLPLSAQLSPETSDLPSSKKVSTKQAIELITSKSETDSSSIKPIVITAKPKINKNDEEAFEALMNSETDKNKKALTAQVLNEMLSEDINDELSLLLVKNNSDCNMVLKVEGKSSYNMPIPANGQNAIMVEKGVYQLKGNVCELKYEAEKDLNKNILVSLKRMED